MQFFNCYNSLTFYYKRKYNKFLQRINHSSYDKYKQVQTISSPVTKSQGWALVSLLYSTISSFKC